MCQNDGTAAKFDEEVEVFCREVSRTGMNSRQARRRQIAAICDGFSSRLFVIRSPRQEVT